MAILCLLFLYVYSAVSSTCADLEGGFGLCWTIAEELISFTFVGKSQGNGYIAIGFSPTGGATPMIGSNAVVGWSNPSPAYSFIGDYFLGDKTSSAVVLQGNQNLTQTSVAITGNSILTLAFTRPLNATLAPPVLDPTGSNNLIWSYGPLPPQNVYSISHHYNAYHGSVNFATGDVVSGPDDPAVKAHATLMVLGWIVCIFWGQMVARFGKGNPNWFLFHRGLVLTGLLFVGIAWCIGVFRIGSGTQTGHFAIGTVAFVIICLQPLNAVCRPHAPAEGEAPTTARYLWQLLHHWLGRLALLLALINTYIGLSIHNTSKGVVAFYSIVVASFLLLFFYLQWRSSQRSKSTFLPTSDETDTSGARTAI